VRRPPPHPEERPQGASRRWLSRRRVGIFDHREASASFSASRAFETAGRCRGAPRAVDHVRRCRAEFLVKVGASRKLVEGAVDLDALKAFLRYSASSFLYSPLRPRTTGGQQIEPCASGSASTRSTICDTVWLSMGAPWRANRARRRGPEQAHVVVDLGDVATVERGFFDVVFCSIEIAGDRAVDLVDVASASSPETGAHRPTAIRP